MAEPEFDAVLRAVRDRIAATPGLAAAHYPPPENLGQRLPCAIVQAAEGDIDLGSVEAETEWWRHQVRVDVLAERANLPARYPVVVNLLKAVARRFRGGLQLAGAVNLCVPVRYTVGARRYADADWTGGTLFLLVEERYEVEILP